MDVSWYVTASLGTFIAHSIVSVIWSVFVICLFNDIQEYRTMCVHLILQDQNTVTETYLLMQIVYQDGTMSFKSDG
jgi:hypothetical protein